MLHVIHPVTHHLLKCALAPPPWEFDAVSALIGAVAALVLVGLIYYLRGALRRSWEAMVAPLARLAQRLQASTEDRYRELVATRARSLILPARAVPLDAVFVEPELLVPIPPPESTTEIDALPAGHRVLPLRRILGEHPQLVILGAPGAGKTALLAYVALACARAAEDSAEVKVPLRAAQERLPLYVPLLAMDWDEPSAEDGKRGKEDRRKGSAINRLIGTAMTAVGGSQGMVGALRGHLEAGRAIVLVDGWDELYPQQRQYATAWLSELIGAMPGNLWLVGAEPRGYAPLTEAGFVPLKLAAWDAGRVELFARRWVKASLSADTESGESAAILRQLTAALWHAARVEACPLELALRAFVHLSDGQAPSQRAALFDRTLDLLQSEKEEERFWLPTTCRTVLEQLALDLQQAERATVSREEVEAAVESALPLTEELPPRADAHVFRALTGERGLLRPAGPDRYAFAHPLWQAYLAARQLSAFDSGNLVERLDDARWAEVLGFYAEVGDMGPLVAAWLRGPDDIFRTRLRALGFWIRVAPENAGWRDGAMAILARGFLQGRHSAQVQQGLAKALAATDLPGVTYLFKQALQHPDAKIRRAAITGLTLTRTTGDSDLPALEAAMADEAPGVREAIVQGLVHLGTDAAMRWLARIFLEEEESLSIVAAEALAQCGKEGADFLHEAVESEDIVARRAAVFGLARIGARDLLKKVAREDEQWIVRSAAAMALDELEEQERVSGVAPPLGVEQLPWLVSWAAARGEGVGSGNAARQMLRRALNEGDAATRLAAAQVLAQVGRPDDVEPLRAALTTPDVADVALEALAQICERYALKIE